MINYCDWEALISLGRALGGVILGYCLANFKEWLNRNKLRYSLLKQLWNGLLKENNILIIQEESHIITPLRLSTIETILASGVLEDNKYHNLLNAILELHGWSINHNVWTNYSNLYFVIHGSNSSFNDGSFIFAQGALEQSKIITMEIKKLYPNRDWQKQKNN